MEIMNMESDQVKSFKKMKKKEKSIWQSFFIVFTLMAHVFLPGILYAKDDEPGDEPKKTTDKKYDFYSENQYKSIDDELNQHKKNESGVDELFLYREMDKKDASSKKDVEKNTIFQYKPGEKKVKILLGNNTAIIGVTPFYVDQFKIVTENNGVEYTKDIETDKIQSIEFMEWVCMGKFPVSNQDGYVREKYYFVPSRAKVLLNDKVVYEGKINPFDFLNFNLANSNGTGNYSTFFFDTWEPDPGL
jgi:hypothetical protein